MKIAGIPVGVENRYELVRFRCREFISDEAPEFVVSVTDEDIKEFMLPGHEEPYAEYLAVLKALSDYLADYDAFLMHAAVIDIDGYGIAFTAESGTGKTTRVRMWLDAFGERLKVINGDKPILRFMDGSLMACGTPWNGKENVGSTSMIPLRAVCFLERSEEVSLRRMKTAEALPRLLKQLLIPREAGTLDRSLTLIDRMLEQVPCYLLKCNKDKESPAEIWAQMREDLA